MRNFNLASLQLILGPSLFFGGSLFGLYSWWQALATGVFASAGTVMFAALPIIIGLQLTLSAINFDMANIPKNPKHPIFMRTLPNHAAKKLSEEPQSNME